MSAENSSSINEVKEQIRQGTDAMEPAFDSLRAGSEAAEALSAEADVHRAALNDALRFFSGLDERVTNEVDPHFDKARELYEKAGKLITQAVTGASEDNEHAQAAKEGCDRIDRKVESAVLGNIAMLREKGRSGSRLEEVSKHLFEAEGLAGDIALQLGGASIEGAMIANSLHAQTAVAAQLYGESL